MEYITAIRFRRTDWKLVVPDHVHKFQMIAVLFSFTSFDTSYSVKKIQYNLEDFVYVVAPVACQADWDTTILHIVGFELC
jgi:hypothetical protein